MTRLERQKPRAQAVADELRALVREQRFVPGDKLPSEAELVRTLGVGRSSVREGIQLLESLGIVEVEHGKGTFLASAVGGGLNRVIDWAYQADDEEDAIRLIYDLLEARAIVETAQARLAAERATLPELDQLQQNFFAADDEDPETLTKAEAESVGLDYHHAIARIAHNDVLLIMSNAIRPLYMSLVEPLERPAKDVSSLLKWHTVITEAIVRRDVDAAGQAMTDHLEENRRVLDRWLKLKKASRIS